MTKNELTLQMSGLAYLGFAEKVSISDSKSYLFAQNCVKKS